MSCTMPAGTYYIGDCCYVLREDQHENFCWVNDFCEQFFDAEFDEDSFEILGERVIAFSTKWGDGCYSSNVGFMFPVDAGLIGAVPSSLWKGSEPPFGCKLVTFDKDFECFNEDGILTFGHVVIDTACDEED